MPLPAPIPTPSDPAGESSGVHRTAIRLSPAASAAAGALLLISRGLPAQMHKVATPERVTRAVGVYEWTGSLDKPTAARFIPVSLFINSHFEDAGVYLARPVPFALQTGDIYSVEKAGQGEGLLDLELARDVVTQRSQADDDPLGTWYGYGTFRPPAPERPAAALQASAHPSAIVASNDDDDRPHFVTRPGATAPPPPSSSTTPAASSGSTAPASTGGAPTPEPPDSSDPDRPTLRRRDAPADPKHRKKGSDSGVIPTERSLNDDPDRPTMRRGDPEETASTPPLTGLPADLHQAVAVSDPANRDPHLFARAWESPAERATTLADLKKIALPQVAAYVKTNGLVPGTPEAASPATAGSGPAGSGASAGTASSSAAPSAPGDAGGPPKLARGVPRDYASQASGTAPAAAKAPTAAKTPPAARAKPAARSHARAKTSAPAPLALTDEQITPLTLSYGGLPTFVYTAQAPLRTGGPVFVTVVAQRLPSGELQVALHSITDAGHLNRVPWMRFIDAVDPDASHRASLLFELRAQTGRQFALYRLVSVNAEQTMTTGLIE